MSSSFYGVITGVTKSTGILARPYLKWPWHIFALGICAWALRTCDSSWKGQGDNAQLVCMSSWMYFIRRLDHAQAFSCHEREPVGMTIGMVHPMFPPNIYLPIYLPSWVLLHQWCSIFLMILLNHKELLFFTWCNAISITFTISPILRDHTEKQKLFPLVGAGTWLRP